MRWQRAVNRALRPLRLTHTQLLVLHATERAGVEHGRGASHAVIAREAGLDRATTGAVLRALEARDFVDAEPASGGNAWEVSLTSEGLRALRSAAPLVESAIETLADATNEESTPRRRARRGPVPSPSSSG